MPCDSCAQAALFGSAQFVLFDWKPEMGTALHLVNLATGAVRKLDAPPFFTFHYINAFETADGSAMCVDFARCARSALPPHPLMRYSRSSICAALWACFRACQLAITRAEMDPARSNNESSSSI